MKALIVVADGFHLGQVGCYGNDWNATPGLDRLAAGSVVFDQHIVDVPTRAGAWHAWLTGKHAFSSTEQPARLIEVLQEAGVRVEFLSDNDPPRAGLSWLKAADFEELMATTVDAFDQLADEPSWLLWVETSVLLPPWPAPQEEEQAEEEAVDDDDPAESEDDDGAIDADTEADDLIDENEEPEIEIDPITEPTSEMLEDDPDDWNFLGIRLTQAEALAELDAGIRLLLERLEDDVLFIVTAPRSYPLGEHGFVGFDKPWPHEELVHVPLLIRLPGGAEAGRRVPHLTQPTDLLPTLLDCAAATVPDDCAGASLLPLTLGGTPIRTAAVSMVRQGEEEECALRTPDWAYLSPADGPRQPQLYVKPDDRWEVNDVAQHHPELIEESEKKLREFLERKE